jgi:hypothetical protein
MAAIPPLAQVSRYSDVRRTDAAQVMRVLNGLVVRVCIGLVMACQALDDEAAADMAGRIRGLHTAIKLADQPDHRDAWLNTLRQAADAGGIHDRVRGLAARLLLDECYDTAEDAAARMSRALSRAAAPESAAAWLEGFLSDGGTVLVHDDALFRLADQWVTGLSADHFVQVLPLVRRTFATFPAPARRQIGERVKRETGNGSLAGPAASTEDWNMARAEALIPTLRRILGIESST